MKPIPIVYVEWVDAIGCTAGWETKPNLQKIDGSTQTIGFLLDENEEFILAAGHYLKGHVQGAMAIPWMCITSYNVVEWV